MRSFLPSRIEGQDVGAAGFAAPGGAERVAGLRSFAARRRRASPCPRRRWSRSRPTHTLSSHPARTRRRACDGRRPADAERWFRRRRAPRDRHCGRGSGRRHRCRRHRPIADRVRADRTRCRTDRSARKRTPRVAPLRRRSARNTRMRPASLSATNTSPFGAVRMMRGPDKPEANRLTSKPFGTIGFWIGPVHYSDDIPARIWQGQAPENLAA